MKGQVRSITPIFPVSDIGATLRFYKEKLAATNDWRWGMPTNHAGCTIGAVDFQFTLNPELCVSSRGLSMFLSVLNVDELYDQHMSAGLTLLDEFGVKPWGTKEYAIEDCNGVRLRFAQFGFTKPRRPKLEGVNLVRRRLLPAELGALMVSVQWIVDSQDFLLKSVADPLFTVVAEYADKIIGTASILGHETGNYLIYNVIVHSDYQSQGVGKMLMQDVDDWLTKNGVPHAMVKLFTGLDRQEFYGQFGFRGPDTGLVGMNKILN